jgi:hypothetical protein
MNEIGGTSMKRVIKWGLLAVVLLLVIGVAAVYFRLGSIVEYVVESQGTKQTNLTTALGGASVGLVGGNVELDRLQIDNPPGFSTQHLFTLGQLDVQAPFTQLRGNPSASRASRSTSPRSSSSGRPTASSTSARPSTKCPNPRRRPRG